MEFFWSTTGGAVVFCARGGVDAEDCEVAAQATAECWVSGFAVFSADEVTPEVCFGAAIIGKVRFEITGGEESLPAAADGGGSAATTGCFDIVAGREVIRPAVPDEETEEDAKTETITLLPCETSGEDTGGDLVEGAEELVPEVREEERAPEAPDFIDMIGAVDTE